MQFWTAEIEKQIASRVQYALTDPDMRSLVERFGADIVRRSSVFHGLAAFLREHDVRGELAFEVGTWNGCTAAVLARHFKRVVTVDIANNPLKHEVLAHLGITNVRCIDIKDNVAKWRAYRKHATGCDFAYLDGDHASDTDTDFELVRSCGRVLFHECWPHQPPVWELVHKLPMRQVTHGGCGLALWQIREGMVP